MLQHKSITEYLRGLPDDDARNEFAKRLNTSVGHLRNIGYRCSVCHPKLATAIWRATGGVVQRQSLCPEDYWLIWPELQPPQPAEQAA